MAHKINNILLSCLAIMFFVACGGSGGSSDPLVGTWKVSSIDGNAMPIAIDDTTTLSSIIIYIEESPEGDSNYDFLQYTKYEYPGGETMTCEDQATLKETP